MQKSWFRDERFRVDWLKLNNAVFGRIRADKDLLDRYVAATSEEANQICADVFDEIVSDPEDFVNRFIILEF